ncbi:MAG: class I SAM-dependent methyltransferase, partial [Gammaproteobacteria bacterium]
RFHRNTLADSKQNIHYHYDIGNAFYRLWLDEDMVYTCAYFADAGMTLEQAQKAKLDLVCRKLGLRPGLHVAEAGCGWGSLALHMAGQYGVTVKAYNISREQVAYARNRAAAAGLADRIEFIEDDYRNLRGDFDAFVSVGMLEHVGTENYSVLGSVIDRCLKDEGRGLIHSIGRNRAMPMNSWTGKRIFPGSYAPSLREMMDVLEPGGFSVLDVENLRLHYAHTLVKWLERFEEKHEQVRKLYDDAFVRCWRLYLASSAAAFLAGNLQLFQVVFARFSNNAIPLTRAHLYRDGEAGYRQFR